MKVDLTSMEWQVVLGYLTDAMALHSRRNHPDDAVNVMNLIIQIDSQVNPKQEPPTTSERPHPDDYRD